MPNFSTGVDKSPDFEGSSPYIVDNLEFFLFF